LLLVFIFVYFLQHRQRSLKRRDQSLGTAKEKFRFNFALCLWPRNSLGVHMLLQIKNGTCWHVVRHRRGKWALGTSHRLFDSHGTLGRSGIAIETNSRPQKLGFWAFERETD
jgi:hypothetical protein